MKFPQLVKHRKIEARIYGKRADYPLFRRIGHIEISGAKSKTRQHRLVEVAPALQQWLEPFRGMEGKLVKTWTRPNSYDRAFRILRESLKIPSRKNGLRHAFCTYHFALHANENLTAAQAGNSPAMIFGREGRTLLVLLGGGSKRRQDADIADAVARWKRYKQTKP